MPPLLVARFAPIVLCLTSVAKLELGCEELDDLLHASQSQRRSSLFRQVPAQTNVELLKTPTFIAFFKGTRAQYPNEVPQHRFSARCAALQQRPPLQRIPPSDVLNVVDGECKHVCVLFPPSLNILVHHLTASVTHLFVHQRRVNDVLAWVAMHPSVKLRRPDLRPHVVRVVHDKPRFQTHGSTAQRKTVRPFTASALPKALHAPEVMSCDCPYLVWSNFSGLL